MKRNSRAFTLVFGLIATLFILCNRPAMASIVPGSALTVEQTVLTYVTIQGGSGVTWKLYNNAPLQIPYEQIAAACPNSYNGTCGIGFYDPAGNLIGSIGFNFMMPPNHYIFATKNYNSKYFVISDLKSAVAVRAY